MAQFLVGISHECDYPSSIMKVCSTCSVLCAIVAARAAAHGLPTRCCELPYELRARISSLMSTPIGASQLPSCSEPNMDPDAPSVAIDTAVRDIVKVIALSPHDALWSTRRCSPCC